MRAVLIAPFLSSASLDLAVLVTSDPHGLRHDLAELGMPGWEVLRPTAAHASALIHEHEPVEATLAPRRLLSARLTDPDHPAWQPGVESVELALGVHGTGAVLFHCDVPSPDRLARVEDDCCGYVGELAASASALLRACRVPSTHRRAGGQYPVDEFLWWHRLLVPANARGEAACERLLLGATERVLGRPEERLRVGDGYSVLSPSAGPSLAPVVRGLVDAQEVWVAGESGAREVVVQIAELQAQAGWGAAALSSAAALAESVAEAEELRTAVLQDQIRYTTGARRLALACAADAWGMSLDLQPVRHHLRTLRDMLQRRLDERRLRQERRLSLWVFALGLVTTLGLLLGIFETAFGLPLETHAARLAFAAGVVALMAGALIGCAAYFRRNRL